MLFDPALLKIHLKQKSLSLLLCAFLSFSGFFSPILSKNAFAQVNPGELPLVGMASLELGRAEAQGELKNIIDDSQALRVKLFYGLLAPNLSWLGAAGYGLDLTYSSHDPAASITQDQGFEYERLLWQWIWIPYSIGPFFFKAALSWQWTKTSLPQLGIDESSFRPGLNLETGIRWPVANHWGLRAALRANQVVEDTETSDADDEVTVVGPITEAFVGVDYLF
jgi:hypothetical protein